MSTAAEALAARLRERMDRYNVALDAAPDADHAEILSTETAALRRDLIVAALTDEAGRIAELDGLDAEPFWLAAWAAEFRDNAFATSGDQSRARAEGVNAMRLFLVVDRLRPESVPSHQRARIDVLTAAGTVLDLSYRERELAEVLCGDERSDLAAIDVAVTLLRRSIDRDAGNQVERWNPLMRALWRRYRLSSHVDDIAAVVDAAERVAALADGANRVIALCQVGAAEQERYDRTSAASSLRRCVTVLSEALDLTPVGNRGRTEMLVSLGVALRTRGSLERSPDDLARAIALTREALADTTMGSASQASTLSMLALALHARFELTRSEPDLAEAVSTAREAADVDVDEDRAVRLGNLGLVLGTWYRHRRDRHDLAELVAVAQRAAALPTDRYQHGHALGLLSMALTYKADASGRLEDLNEAIRAARGAVAALTDHPDRAYNLHNLAKALLTRFQHTQGIDDLDESIEVARMGTMVSTSDDPRRAGRLSLLAGVLEDRYRLRDDIDDLLSAVAAGEEAVLCSPASSAEHAALLTNLSNARRALAERTKQLADADAAIQVAARALSIGSHAATRSMRQMNLASCHATRFRITSDLTDLDRAVGLLRDALAGLAMPDPDRCTYLSELGQRLVDRYASDPDRRDPGTLAEAIGLFREATSLAVAPAVTRVRAAGRWGLAAAKHGLLDEATAGYSAAVHLLPLAAWHGLDRRSQERQLMIWNPIVTSAAAWAVKLGRSNEAVELLERGRSVLWAHQLGRRADLIALRAVRSDLADRLDEIRIALDRGTGSTPEP